MANELEFNAATSARLAGVSNEAFRRWGLKPVRREGREAFYRWSEVERMRDAKRAMRTNPIDVGGASPHMGRAQRLGLEIGGAAEEAIARGDLPEATRLIGRLQDVVTGQTGIDPRDE